MECVNVRILGGVNVGILYGDVIVEILWGAMTTVGDVNVGIL